MFHSSLLTTVPGAVEDTKNKQETDAKLTFVCHNFNLLKEQE